MLTRDLLFELFEIKNGQLIARFDGVNRKKGQSVGSSAEFGPCSVSINNKRYLRSRLIFLMTQGYLPKEVDHINRNNLDDRPENLRAARPSQNSANQKDRARRHVLPRGVWMCHGRFQTRITFQRKQIHLGTYDTADEAHQAYRAGLRKYFKEFSPYAV